MKKVLYFLLAVVLMTSCVGVTDVTSPNSVSLNQANFKFIRPVTAEVKAHYVFGMGGVKEKANEDVVNKLIEEADLQPNQALANIHVKTTCRCYLGIYTNIKTSASAQIVEFSDAKTGKFAVHPPRHKKQRPAMKHRQGTVKHQTPVGVQKPEVEADKAKQETAVKGEDVAVKEAEVVKVDGTFNPNEVYKRLDAIHKKLKAGETENLNKYVEEVNQLRDSYNSIDQTYIDIEKNCAK